VCFNRHTRDSLNYQSKDDIVHVGILVYSLSVAWGTREGKVTGPGPARGGAHVVRGGQQIFVFGEFFVIQSGSVAAKEAYSDVGVVICEGNAVSAPSEHLGEARLPGKIIVLDEQT